MSASNNGQIPAVLQVFFSVCNYFEAANKAVKAWENDELGGFEKAITVGTNLLVAGSELGNIARAGRDDDDELKEGFRAFSHAAHMSEKLRSVICKKGSTGEDILDALDETLFRSVEIFKIPLVQTKIKQVVKSEPTFAAIMRGHHIIDLIHQQLQQRARVNQAYQRNNPQQQRPVPQQPDLNIPDAEIDIDALNQFREMDALFQNNNIDQHPRIPEVLETAFDNFPHCMMTGQPIRHLLQIIIPEITDNHAPIYVEADAFMTWMGTHAEGSIPGWPEYLPFIREELDPTPVEQEQNRINQHLQNLLNELREVHQAQN